MIYLVEILYVFVSNVELIENIQIVEYVFVFVFCVCFLWANRKTCQIKYRLDSTENAFADKIKITKTFA